MSKPDFEVWAREAERMRDEALAEDEMARDKAAEADGGTEQSVKSMARTAAKEVRLPALSERDRAHPRLPNPASQGSGHARSAYISVPEKTEACYCVLYCCMNA